MVPAHFLNISELGNKKSLIQAQQSSYKQGIAFRYGIMVKLSRGLAIFFNKFTADLDTLRIKKHIQSGSR